VWHDRVVRPQGDWSPVGPYRAQKRLRFIFWAALLATVLFFLLGEAMVVLVEGGGYIDGASYACCYSVGAGVSIVLGYIALRYYRHHLILGIADDPVYKGYRVTDPADLMKVIDDALGALSVEHVRLDPPGPAYTERRRFPRNLRGMYRVSDPDLVIVVYSSALKGDVTYRCDVIVGPVNDTNRSQVAEVLRAVDEGRTVGRPALNVRTA